jgi:hypothetical protein
MPRLWLSAASYTAQSRTDQPLFHDAALTRRNAPLSDTFSPRHALVPFT